MSDIIKSASDLPVFDKVEFHCPHCGVYTHQLWEKPSLRHTTRISLSTYHPYISHCIRCHKQCLWVDEKMILPDISNAPSPNNDLPDEVKKFTRKQHRYC